MDFLISNAWAEGAPASQSDPIMGLLPLVILFVIFYFLLIRPQQKKAKEQRNMVAALAKGDEVITGGGILGKITNIGDTFLDIEIADGVTIKLQRHMVVQLMPKGTLKSS